MEDPSFAWAVEDRETPYSCPGFDIVREEVRLPDGTETDFDYLDAPPSVVILPLTADGAIILIREWREAVQRVNRGLPTGTAEPNDADLRETATRELEEETGYVAEDIEALLTVEPANGVAAIEHHYFLAHGCTPTGTQSLDADETITVVEAPYAEVLQQAMAGDIRDGRTLLGLLYYHAGRSDTLRNGPRKADL